MTLGEIDEGMVRELAGGTIFARGESYLRNGHVLSVVQRGAALYARVQGSEDEPYSVVVRQVGSGVLEPVCDCPYYAPWCKHAVAAVLAYTREPEEVEERSPLDSLLASLDAERMRAMVADLAGEDPDWIDAIEGWIEDYAAAEATGSGDVAAAVARVRQQVRAALRRLGQGRGYRDSWDYDGGSVLLEELGSIISGAAARKGDQQVALAELGALTDALVEQWGAVAHTEVEPDAFLDDLGWAWTVAILRADLPPAERERVLAKLRGWDAALGEAAGEGWLETPIRAAQEGLEPPGGPDAPDADGDGTLAAARCQVFHEHGRYDVEARVALANDLTNEYVGALLATGRLHEAADYVLEHITWPSPMLSYARALAVAGAPDEAIRVAERAMALDTAGFEAAPWLSQYAAEHGRPDVALRAARVAAEVAPSVERVRLLRELAGADWPEMRDEVLSKIRESPHLSVDALVDILIDEGMIPEALDAAEGQSRSPEALARAVEAAAELLPERVAGLARQHVAIELQVGHASHYDAAVWWLRQARRAATATGELPQWRTYVHRLIDEYPTRRKLVEMLSALLSER